MASVPFPVPPGNRLLVWLSIFLSFLRLGLTSFGGPIAHLGFFRHEFVEQRKWLDDRSYADLVSLAQFLPGPASSQVGIGLGLLRGGLPGAFCAWLGFTLPSAVLLMLFGLLMRHGGSVLGDHWLHGLKLAAVAVVAQAVWGMGKSLCPDRERASMAVFAAGAAACWPGVWTQLAVIVVGGVLGWRWLDGESAAATPFQLVRGRNAAVFALLIFALLLLVLPLLARSGGHGWPLADRFFRAGALVFGGGHVVLPVLQAEVVPQGWVSNGDFLAGYGVAQVVPGPMFSFAAYLGVVSAATPHGWLGGIIALVAIFLPGFLLMIGVLPFWDRLRHRPAARNVMRGVNAAVVGLLLAALHDPVWTGAIHDGSDFSLALLAFLALLFWRWPAWAVVALCAAAAGLLAL
jgi:chromate transporter